MNRYFVTINNREYSITLEQPDIAVVNGERIPVDIQQIDQRSFSLLVNGQSKKIIAEKINNTYQIQVNGKQMEAVVESERTRLLKQFESQSSTVTSKSEIRAPMPALVIRIEVSVGEEVIQGQGLIVLEAMKMENEIKAQRPGRVKEICVTKSQPVEKGELIMLLE